MPYEIFGDKATRITDPALSINPDGRISLNAAASQIFHKSGVEFVLLMWDKEGRKLALRPCSNRKDTRAYKVSFGKRLNAAGVSAKSFIDYTGITYTTRFTVRAAWNQGENLLEGVVPKEKLKGSRPTPVRQAS